MNFKKKSDVILKIILPLLLAVSFIAIGVVFSNDKKIIKNNQNNQNSPSQIATKETSATIGSMGDLLLHSSVLDSCYDESSKSYNFDDIFTFINPYIQKMDYASTDLEGSLAGSNYSGYPLFRYPDEIIDSAKKAGFDLFLFANNHTNDAEATGFLRTLKILKEKNVDFIGSRESQSDKNYLVKNINGIKFGMVNYTYGDINYDETVSVNGIPSTVETSKLLNVFDYSKLDNFYEQQQQIIQNLKKDGAEVIVYYMHWGTEYKLQANFYQKQIAQKLCDLGVDVIIGGHPHVIQPMEVLKSDISNKNTVCIYSVGNAISNQRIQFMDDIKTGHTEDGVLFNVTFKRSSDNKVKLADVNVLPTWVHMFTKSGKRNYQIIPLDKSVDWQTNFNLSSSSTGSTDAQNSYNRTMELLSEGLNEAKKITQT